MEPAMQPTGRTKQYLDAYISIPAACRALVPGMTYYSLHRRCELGEIPSIMCGRVRKVRRRDVLAWEQAQREGGNPVPVLETVSGFDPLKD